MKPLRAVVKPDKTVGVSEHHTAKAAPGQFKGIGASGAKMRAVADGDSRDPRLTGKFGGPFDGLVHGARAMGMVGVEHAGAGLDAGKGDFRPSIQPAAAKRGLIMRQQSDSVAVDAMDAGMQHGACCVAGGRLVCPCGFEDCPAEIRQVVCRYRFCVALF